MKCRDLAAVTAAAMLAIAPVRAQQPAPTGTAGTVKPLPTDEAREKNLTAYVELLRSDLRTQKMAVVGGVLGLTDAEDKVFWPVYRDYETQLSKLNDERLKLVDTYAQNFSAMSDSVANDLVMKSLDLEARRVALKQKYYARLRSVMTPVTAARAIQVENQIQLLLDLQVVSALPVVEGDSAETKGVAP